MKRPKGFRIWCMIRLRKLSLGPGIRAEVIRNKGHKRSVSKNDVYFVVTTRTIGNVKKLGGCIGPINHVSPARGSRAGESSNKAGRKFRSCILNLFGGSRVTKEGVGRKARTVTSKARSC